MSQKISPVNLTRKQSTVIVTGIVDSTGQEVFQEVPLEHDIDAPVPSVIANAFTLIRQTGGILIDANEKGSMYWYPLVALRSLHFKYKDQRVSLATSGLVTQ